MLKTHKTLKHNIKHSLSIKHRVEIVHEDVNVLSLDSFADEN